MVPAEVAVKPRDAVKDVIATGPRSVDARIGLLNSPSFGISIPTISLHAHNFSHGGRSRVCSAASCSAEVVVSPTSHAGPPAAAGCRRRTVRMRSVLRFMAASALMAGGSIFKVGQYANYQTVFLLDVSLKHSPVASVKTWRWSTTRSTIGFIGTDDEISCCRPFLSTCSPRQQWRVPALLLSTVAHIGVLHSPRGFRCSCRHSAGDLPESRRQGGSHGMRRRALADRVGFGGNNRLVFRDKGALFHAVELLL